MRRKEFLLINVSIILIIIITLFPLLLNLKSYRYQTVRNGTLTVYTAENTSTKYYLFETLDTKYKVIDRKLYTYKTYAKVYESKIIVYTDYYLRVERGKFKFEKTDKIEITNFTHYEIS